MQEGTETEVMWPRNMGELRAGRGRKGPPLEITEGVCLLTPRFQTPGPQSCERMGFCVVIHRVCGHGLGQPQETNAHPTFFFLWKLVHGLLHGSCRRARTCLCCSQAEPSDRDSSRRRRKRVSQCGRGSRLQSSGPTPPWEAALLEMESASTSWGCEGPSQAYSVAHEAQGMGEASSPSPQGSLPLP